MFEVNVFTPAQFGAFVAWLVINRGPLSVLVHPNTGDDEVSNRFDFFSCGKRELRLIGGLVERSYAESDLDGRAAAVGFESVQANEGGESEVGDR